MCVLHLGHNGQTQRAFSTRIALLRCTRWPISLARSVHFSCYDEGAPRDVDVPCECVGIPLRGHDGSKLWSFPDESRPGKRCWTCWRRSRSLTGGVPTVWLAVLNALDCHPGRWKLAPGLRIAVAGSAAPESMFRRFDKLGVRVIQPWGMTETTPLATVSHLKPHIENWTGRRPIRRSRQAGRCASPFIEVRSIGDASETYRGTVLLRAIADSRAVESPGGYFKLDPGDRWIDGWFFMPETWSPHRQRGAT